MHREVDRTLVHFELPPEFAVRVVESGVQVKLRNYCSRLQAYVRISLEPVVRPLGVCVALCFLTEPIQWDFFPHFQELDQMSPYLNTKSRQKDNDNPIAQSQSHWLSTTKRILLTSDLVTGCSCNGATMQTVKIDHFKESCISSVLPVRLICLSDFHFSISIQSPGQPRPIQASSSSL